MRPIESNDKVERLKDITHALHAKAKSVRESKQEKPWQVSSQRSSPSAPTRS